ncbi:hypothetical protein GF373_15155 [bacterium]|nr:hypothetical protein [bacterium]
MNEYKRFEHFLRTSKLHPTINPRHREQLRRCLLTKKPKPFYHRYAPAYVTVLLVVYAAMYFAIFYYQQTGVGQAKWEHSHKTADVYGKGKVYRTQNRPMQVTLADQSVLEFSPNSVFAIQSTTTDRQSEDFILELKQGTLAVDVHPDLPHGFHIKTPNLLVRVTGTRFTISVSRLGTVLE